jgi:tetratricopeptide (TPR) repeat protein
MKAYRLAIAGFMLCFVFSSPETIRAQELEKALDAVEMNILGKKFPELETESRLELLERKLKSEPVPNASQQYRVNQIFSAQQIAITEERKREAIRFYNKGIDEAQQTNLEPAIASYHEAIRLNPQLIPAYNNLANLQEKLHQYDDAIATYQKALEMAPKEALLHFNLAVILEKQGRIQEAYEHYRQYVQLSPTPNPQIVELIRNFDIKHLASKNKPDYTELAIKESRGERLVWPVQQIPVPVYIRLTDQAQSVFVPGIYDNLDTWTRVTDGHLRFREVGYPDEARIIITLKPGPLMDPNASIGHASFNSDSLYTDNPMKSLKVSITVNTGERFSDLSIENRKEQVRKLVLHELGHAIGIWGHSKDPNDIMYTHPIVSSLSQRDIKTVRRLYGIR